MNILIIEDNEKLNRFITRGLEKSGYVVESVLTGKQGLSYATFGSYDCIVLDIMLPDIDGFTLCNELRSKGVQSPILILTAKNLPDDKITGFTAGADDYLTKPFSFTELELRIKALLRRPKQILSENLTVGDLSLHTQSHTVQRGNTSIPLSTKEYLVLELLLRHKGSVVTREQILDHCWGYNFDSFSNVVEVCVRRIRKKLDEHDSEKYIKTIRGVGYRID